MKGTRGPIELKKEARNKSSLWLPLCAIFAIVLNLLLRQTGVPSFWQNLPCIFVLALGGIPLVWKLICKAAQGNLGADFVAGVSIATSVVLQEYLTGTIVVLMLSGGEALESYATASASSVLSALSERMPAFARRKEAAGSKVVPIEEIKPGDILDVFPHEVCPVDGEVIEGQGRMDESFLTGEPFRIRKTVGTEVISGAINGDTPLIVRCVRAPSDSRYAKVMKVMQDSALARPRMRRLGDQLGGYYTPLSLIIAAIAGWLSGDPIRFLAVLVVATPCPLLIAIPVAIVGSISLAARRGIVIKNPAVLEQASICRTAIFDKTGTLTYGEPALVELVTLGPYSADEVLAVTASLERYSRHPLAKPILERAKSKELGLKEAVEVREVPGQGLEGIVEGLRVKITGRSQFSGSLPPSAAGLECVVIINGCIAALLQFRDSPRLGSKSFVTHLRPSHNIPRTLIVSGDRAAEVEYLAGQVGITEVYADQSPSDKLKIVQAETRRAKTLYVGDGINDAPAMLAATVGVAIGHNSDVAIEAAGAVVLDNALEKVDELLHISNRMRAIALQSAVGGMLLSGLGMAFAALGYLSPVAGALAQELIDVLALVNSLRVAIPPRQLSDMTLP